MDYHMLLLLLTSGMIVGIMTIGSDIGTFVLRGFDSHHVVVLKRHFR